MGIQPKCRVRNSTWSRGVRVSMHLEQILWLAPLNKYHRTYLTHFLVRNLLTNFLFLFVWLRLGSSCCDKVDKNKSWNNQVTKLFGPESTDTVWRTIKSMEKWVAGIGVYWVYKQMKRVYLEYGQITRCTLDKWELLKISAPSGKTSMHNFA